MTRKRAFLMALVAAGLGLMAGSSALALEATADTALNVRAGPGTSHVVVDTLPTGQLVTVNESTCTTDAWCYITWPGDDGWVNTDYLTPASGSGGVPGTPDCRFELTIDAGGPSLSIICGDGGAGSGSSGGGSLNPNHACFYDGPNFTGQSICRNVGFYPNLTLANDRITSVRLHGTAKVRLCERANMGPFCRDVTASEGQLGPYLDNKASSFRVYTGFLPPLKQACFFKDPNYAGEHYCLRVGTANSLPGWDNQISSILLLHGAEVDVCDGANMTPPCNGYTSNKPTLGPADNKISSLEVK